jgi:hypothetical protein
VQSTNQPDKIAGGLDDQREILKKSIDYIAGRSGWLSRMPVYLSQFTSAFGQAESLSQRLLRQSIHLTLIGIVHDTGMSSNGKVGRYRQANRTAVDLRCRERGKDQHQ